MFDRPLNQVPFLAIDVETTGLDRQRDRIVEIAAVVVAPGQAPRVVLDTLVDPRRPIGARDVHGISEDMVVGAPLFSDLVPTLRAVLAKRIVVAHNGAFDLGFLRAALWRCGWDDPLPWLCTMRAQRALGGSGRWPLWLACSRAGFRTENAHAARQDALATAHLLRHQISLAAHSDVTTLAALTQRARAVGMEDAWLDALETRPWPTPPLILDRARARLRPRKLRSPRARESPSERYLSAVVQVVTSLRVSSEALEDLARRRDALGLDSEALNTVYRTVYRGAIARYAEGGIDPVEQTYLDRLEFCLRFLGWSPRDRSR